MQQIAVRPNGTTTYNNMYLAPATTYYYGIIAVEQGIDAPMSAPAYATTLPLPPPPSNVTGTASSPTKVVLNWQETPLPNGLPVASYQIFQGTTSGDLVKSGAAVAPSTTYTATSLSPNTTYYFEIQAVDSSHDDSAPSSQIAVTTLPMPAAPVNVSAKATAATKVTVTWSENIPAGGLPIQNYTVYRGSSPSALTTKLGTAKGLTYTDMTTSASTTYYYGVEATDTGQDVSPMSAPGSVTTPPMPAAPVNVAATINSSTQITVTWSENIPAGGLPVSNYTINWGTSPSSLTNSAKRTTPSFVDTGLTPGVTYYFAIAASDSGGDVSAQSAMANATTP